ncbi:hypothetical protein BKA70DRAFT_1352579 [Coprinopsis sp. MPI-PUGE-AT-0042]|nr:hypothetical protein BKA70DRAFT_1352579 [Coprinopsis sp. MPI-PUGE-AT-0042]
MVKFEVESESCVRTSGRLKYQRENGVGQDWSFLRGKSKKDQELFQAKDESKPSIKKEAERTDDKEAVKRRANSDPKQESPSTKARMKKEENGPSSLCVALKQEIKEEIKPGSGLEEEMRVDRRPPAHSHAEPASPSQRYTRRKSSNNTVASDLSSPRGIKVKREISPDALPPPDIDHTAQAGTKVQAVAFQHEPRAAQHLTLEEKQATEKLWRSKIVKKVKPENLRFDLNVLWSRLVTAKIPPDLFPVTLEPAIRDVCVSRVFMSKTWGGSSQRTFPPIDKKKFKHGLDDFMYPGSASQSATPEVPGAPGLWLDVEDTSGTWWRDRYGDTPVRLFTCIVKSPARWQYQGQYRIRIAKTLEKEEWRQQKAEVRNAWAKKMSKGKHYYGLREYLVAKRFLGREPEEDEIEQLHAGTMSTDMSEAEIQLCMTKGDLRMGVYTMECVGYDEDFQRQVAEKWATWVPPPTTKKRKAPKQLAAANKKKRKTGDDKKSKGKIERDAEEEEEEETYDVGSESEDGEDGDDENDGAAYAIYSSGTRSRPRLV